MYCVIPKLHFWIMILLSVSSSWQCTQYEWLPRLRLCLCYPTLWWYFCQFRMVSLGPVHTVATLRSASDWRLQISFMQLSTPNPNVKDNWSSYCNGTTKIYTHARTHARPHTHHPSMNCIHSIHMRAVQATTQALHNSFFRLQNDLWLNNPWL